MKKLIRTAMVAAVAFVVGYTVSSASQRNPNRQSDQPSVEVSVASQGSVFREPGEISSGVADPGDGVLRVDVRRGASTHTTFYPIKGR